MSSEIGKITRKQMREKMNHEEWKRLNQREQERKHFWILLTILVGLGLSALFWLCFVKPE
jgi:hypothetical protein